MVTIMVTSVVGPLKTILMGNFSRLLVCTATTALYLCFMEIVNQIT